MIKFVDNTSHDRRKDSHTESSSSSSGTPGNGHSGAATATAPTTNVTLDIRSQRILTGGGSYHKMRLCPPQAPLLITPSSTSVDQLATRLASQLQVCTDSGHDLRFAGQSICLVPPRLAESVALRDATECLLGAHAALLRGEQYGRLIDPVCYGRALRSLQRALDDPVERYAATTLAATGLLQKTEVRTEVV